MHPDHIISNHTVCTQMDCSMRCLETSTCVGFNYRTNSNKYVANCQLSKETRESGSVETEERGEWEFFQDERTTLSDLHSRFHSTTSPLVSVFLKKMP